MVLREAIEADVPVLADAWYAMMKELGLLAPRVQASWRELLTADFARGMARGRQRWILAEKDGRIAATGGIFFRRDPVALALSGLTATIAGMYTWPDFRRTGCARAIVERLIGYARAEGCASVRLRASPQGRALYERLGFRPGDDMILPLG